MNIEQFINDLKQFLEANNLKYLKKSQAALMAASFNYEWEDVLEFLQYNNDYITRFTETSGDKRYTRYILIKDATTAQIEAATGLHFCNECYNFSATYLTAADGHTFCNLNCAHYSNYYICSKCNKLEKKAYKSGDLVLCKNCLEAYASDFDLVKCNKCGRYYKKDDIFTIDDYKICSSCADSLYLVSDYHHTSKNFKTYVLKREKKITYGYENEMEVKGVTPRNLVALGIDNILEKYGLKGFFKYENDGSLKKYKNIEAITDAFTLPWFYENEKKLQAVYDLLEKLDCSGERTCKAGLHVHVSRTAFTKEGSLVRFAFLVHNLQYDFLKFSRRPLNNLSYAKFDDFSNDDGVYHLEDFKYKYGDVNDYSIAYEHADVINRQHAKTIEFRLFRGTTDLKHIIANIELINNLVYFVENRTDEQVKTATFKEICLFKKTKYLKQFYFQTFEPNVKIKEVD